MRVRIRVRVRVRVRARVRVRVRVSLEAAPLVVGEDRLGERGVDGALVRGRVGFGLGSGWVRVGLGQG